MTLTDLEPQFLHYITGPHPSMAAGVESEYRHYVQTMEAAQGVQFLCPSCFVRNRGAVGTHLIEVSFSNRGVKDNQGSHNRDGKPSRWDVNGTGFPNLSLRPSILIDPAEPACAGWHGFVTNGEVA